MTSSQNKLRWLLGAIIASFSMANPYCGEEATKSRTPKLALFADEL